jgi:ABC-type multidrug transport system ATPase subunit
LQVEGTAHSGGKISYVPQTAWCQNLSLRDNIVFGQPWDASRYSSVLHACALELDLDILAAGDQTKAGLRGINLSGGQRQRLNLARCAYFGGDLVLLDNALSAVDHHTAHHIFEHCVRGMFRDKATVLVTHQVGRPPRASGQAGGWVATAAPHPPAPGLRVLCRGLAGSLLCFAASGLPSAHPAIPPPPSAPLPHACQVEFLPQCDKVAIMDEGTCVYFGPWTPAAQQLLSKYLPASHLLAAGGGAEQPRDTKKKPAKKEAKQVG